MDIFVCCHLEVYIIITIDSRPKTRKNILFLKKWSKVPKQMIKKVQNIRFLGSKMHLKTYILFLFQFVIHPRSLRPVLQDLLAFSWKRCQKIWGVNFLFCTKATLKIVKMPKGIYGPIGNLTAFFYYPS